MIFGSNRVRRWLIHFVPILVIGMGLVTAALAQHPSAGAIEPTETTYAANPQTAAPYYLPPDKLAQAIVLNRIRIALHFGEEVWEIVFLLLMLTTGSVARLGDWCAAKARARWLQAALFAAILTSLLFLAVDIPLSAIGHSYSLRYGISVESWLPWLLDVVKLMGLTVLLETPALTIIFLLMRWSPRRYWLWFSAASVPVVLLFTFLLPPLIEPLFYNFEPLAQSHPTLVQQLERVVARTGTSIPPERMFLMKASEKSNALNAYVTGLGSSKRIVVWDTTADRMPTDEILFTFAHETGHYVLHHIAKGLAAGAVGLFALFWMTAKSAEWLIRRFGKSWRTDSIASLLGLAVLLLSLSAIQSLTEPIPNAASRYAEHEADVYGQETIHGIVADPQKTAVNTFNRLGEASLDDPSPNPFLEFWTDDHPSTQERATFAAHYNPWASGQKPRFFTK